MALEGANNEEIAAYIYDDLTWGLGRIAAEEYWDFAHSTANWIVKQKAFPWLDENFLNKNATQPDPLPDFDNKNGIERAGDYAPREFWLMIREKSPK